MLGVPPIRRVGMSATIATLVLWKPNSFERLIFQEPMVIERSTCMKQHKTHHQSGTNSMACSWRKLG
jgi:hypothetical protein